MASAENAPNMISTIMRNAKFFPVMNGKNMSPGTIKKINGSTNAPARMIFRSVFSILGVLYHAGVTR